MQYLTCIATKPNLILPYKALSMDGILKKFDVVMASIVQIMILAYIVISMFTCKALRLQCILLPALSLTVIVRVKKNYWVLYVGYKKLVQCEYLHFMPYVGK